MKRINILVIITITLFTQQTFSQTKIKYINNTNELVSAAYVKYTGEGNGWESHGWYNVKAGESKEINLGDYQYSKVYIYGYSKSLFWGNGKFQFCIDPKNAFVFPNSDKTCNNTKKKFSELKITKGTVNTWNFNPKKENSSNNLTQQQINEFVKRHNYWRNQIGSPNIVWSESLAEYAHQWAKHLADNNLFEHRSNNKYGENIFTCSSCSKSSYTPSMVVDDWASEKSLYNGETIDYSNYQGFGHYTQIVWCQTTEVGCAMVQTSDGNMIVVCNYAPAGNSIGNKPSCK